MRKTDEAVLLRITKYGESSAIVDMFSRQSGRFQAMFRGAFGSKKKKTLFILSNNEIEYSEPRNPDQMPLMHSIVAKTFCHKVYDKAAYAIWMMFVAEFYLHNTQNGQKDEQQMSHLLWSIERLNQASIQHFPQEFLHHWGLINGSEWSFLWNDALRLDKEGFTINLYSDGFPQFNLLDSKEKRRWAFNLALKILKEHHLINVTEFKSIAASRG